VGVTAQYTKPLNSMVRPDQREYIDAREKEPGVSRGALVRRALDMLMEAEPLPVDGARPTA
jgi:hypothetical protein